MSEHEIYDLAYGEYRGRTVKGFIKYVIAKYRKNSEEKSYKVYITDCLSALTKMNTRWYDFINGTNAEERKQDEAEKVAQALRDSFYGKEES